MNCQRRKERERKKKKKEKQNSTLEIILNYFLFSWIGKQAVINFYVDQVFLFFILICGQVW